MRNDRSGPPARHTALRDLIAVLGVTALSFVIAAELDLAERLRGWAGAHEWIELDEATIVLAVLVVGLSLFSLLRWSERRRDLQERSALESRYRQLVERVPAITYVWDVTGVVGRDQAEFVSPQIEEILGFTVAEWQSTPDIWTRRIHPDDHARVMRDWDAALAAGKPFRAEYRMYAKDGRIVWFRDEAVPDATHGRTLVQGVMFDITQRKDVEQQLRDAEAEYRDLVERIPTITYTEDPKTGRFTYVSPQVTSVLGFTPEEFLVHGTWRSRLHPDDVARIDEDDARSDETGEDFDIEYRIIAKDGREVWVHEHTELIDADGRPPFWLGVIDDITDRRRAEGRVRDAEQRYRKLVERLPAVVYVDAADELSTALYMSPRYEELLGYTWEEQLSQPDLWVRTLHPDDRGWVVAESDRTNQTGEPFICEYRLIAKDGRTVWVRDEAHLVEGEGGGPKIWQGVLLDITERKTAEENLRRREAILPAVGYAAQRFLKDPAWENSVDSVFAHLGEAADVSRVHLSGNVTAADGHLAAARRSEWVAPGTAPSGAAGRRVRSYDKSGTARWAEVLGAGGTLNATRGQVPPGEREVLEGEGTLSLLVVPVTVGGTWWGFLGFDDCRSERAWTPLEVEALKAAADILGTAIHRQLAEHRLADAEAQFRTLVEQLPAVTYIDTMEDQWRTTYVSPQITSMLGYAQGEWEAGRSAWYDALHPDDRDRVLALVDESVAAASPYEAEYRLIAKDGRVVWVRDHAQVVPDQVGGESLWQGVMFDITSRVDSEQYLREAEERFRALVEQSPAMFYIETPDPDAPSVYVSPRVEELFGITAEEYIGDLDAWERRVHPEDVAEAMGAWQTALAAGRSWSLEYRVVHRDGRIIWVRDESTLARDDDGAVVQVQGVMYDITERKLAEQTLIKSERREREAADRLRAIDDMKNTFLAAVSHELRSPLTSILGLALTLERQERISDDDREDLLARLAANARKLDRLLKDLLDIDRLSRGIVTPQYRLTDIGSLVRRTIEGMDAVAGRHLFVQTEPVLIPVDPAKVERIVENLVANAARHTAEETRIWVRVAPKDGGALIVVEDDGPGVPEEIRTSIFEPFQQGPGVSRANPGTGIGLSLVARFAELHGGRAWADEREGGGASFAVLLPGSPDPMGSRGGLSTGTGAA